MANPVCAVVGIGPKNGASFARRFHDEGFTIALLSRTTEYAEGLAADLGRAKAFACDIGDAGAVESAFAKVRRDLGELDVLVLNAGSGTWGNIEELSADDFERSWRVNALGSFLAAKQVIPNMKKEGRGTILMVGATASLRGKPFTTAFAPAKAAQRSLAQAMARHLGPQGIHVALLIVDGGIAKPADDPPKTLDPDHIADVAVFLHKQQSSAWSFEVDLRPMTESW